jgi:phytoene dehydrogenase-like protein
MKHVHAFDAIVLGGGHNGLVCANYLAGAGLRVCVLERRPILGGAAVTETFHPGFRNSSASYTVGLLSPRVIRDLRLATHGLQIIERPLANFLPLGEAGYLQVGGGLQATQRAFARHSKRDAQRLPEYYAMLSGVAELWRRLQHQTPPRLAGGLTDLLDGIRFRRQLGDPPLGVRRDLLSLLGRSAADLLDGWFESEPVKAAFGFDAVVGHFASPYEVGTAYVLLHHVMGEVNGRLGAWGHAIGGMGAISDALTAEAGARGVRFETDAPVGRVEIDAGRVHGVRLESGRVIQAPVVASAVNPMHLFLDLIEPAHLDPDLLRRMRRWKCGSATFRMNVALAELPEFDCRPGDGDHLRSGIIMAPSLDYMDAACLEARRDGWASRPIVEMLIPSTVDDSLAPNGAHVASLFCQHFNPDLPGELEWDQVRDRVADLIIDTVDQHAPNFRRSVLGRMALSPVDLERRFGLPAGDIFHGALSQDQLYSARPMLGHGDYRGPVRGLYLCASGSHPGGGVSGIPGHNAAREILADRRRRWFDRLRLG